MEKGCTTPTPTIDKEDNFVGTFWIEGQEDESADYSNDFDDEFTARRLEEKGTCPFSSAEISFVKRNIDGFPGLEIYFEINTNFSDPMIMNYMLNVETKEKALS